MTLDEIDFWDLDLFTEGDPHAAWRLLRREAPIWFHDRPGGERFWCVTKYDDAKAVHADPVLFSSQRDGIALKSDAQLAAPPRGMGIDPMIHTDPPRHAKLRKVVSHRFTPRSIAALEAELRSIAERCVDEALQKGEIDFVPDIAHRIPSEITFSLMGIPEERWDRLAELEHRTVTSSDPEFTHGKSEQESAAEASAEIVSYFVELVMSRQGAPGDDLLSEFLKGTIDGEELGIGQVVAEAGLLLAGGLDTTRAAASLGGMLQLIEHPDQWERLRNDPELVPSAVEEFVRWATPVVSETRTVTRPTELRGQPLAEGERVTIWTASCNRDEDVFDEPDRFDIERHPNRHLGFAHGEHFCLGAHLARLTLRVEFEELLRRVRTVELVGDPVRVRSNFVGGLKHLPVRLVPA
jgi:cytochrome P450